MRRHTTLGLTFAVAFAVALCVVATSCGDDDPVLVTAPDHDPVVVTEPVVQDPPAGGLLAAAPPAPTPLAPANGANVKVPFAISWSAVIDPSAANGGYNWQVSPSASFSPLIRGDSTNPQATQDTISGLPNGTYFWRVNAASPVFEEGVSAWSQTRSFNVTGVGPGTPGTPVLGPTRGYSTFHPAESIHFNWSVVPDALTYRLEIANDPSFPLDAVFPAFKTFWNENIRTTTDGFVWHQSLGEGNFLARVFAVASDFAGGVRSLPSNVIQFSVFFNNPIGPPPVLLSPINGETLNLPVTLTWAHVPNPQASGYIWEISKNSSFTSIELFYNQTTDPSVTISSLTPGTKFWRVRSSHGLSSPETLDEPGTVANTTWSTTGTFTVGTGPPTPVSIRPVRLPLYSGDDTWVEVQLTSGVPAGGASIALSSSNPAAAPVPETIPIQGTHALTQFQMTAGQVTSPTPVTLIATLNGATASGQFTVEPPSLKSITTASTLSGGVQAGAIVMLNGQAPAGGAVVSLSSDSPAASPPSTATVPAGSYSVPVSFPTSAVATSTTVTITARWKGASVQSQMTLTPQAPPMTLTLTPTSVVGLGGSSFGRVTVASAPSSDLVLPITSSHPAVASVDNIVMIPAGVIHGGFNVFTTSVTVPTVVTISVSGGGVTLSATLTVNPDGSPPPPPPPPGTPTLLSPAGGAIVVQPVSFDWNNVANATSYEIQVDNSSTIAAPFTANQVVTASQATIGGLPAQRLWWRVRARNSAGVFGSFSATRRFTPQAAPAAPSLASLALSPTSVVGGNTSQGTVALTGAAPSGGAVVTLSSSIPSVAATPASVTVPAGSTTATFTISTTAVAATNTATLSATFGGATRTAALTVNPAGTGSLPAPNLVSPANDQRFSPGQSITFDWSNVTGAADYTLQIDDSNSFPTPLILGQAVAASQFTTSTLPTRTMWWRVRASSASGTPGNWSSVRRFEVKN